MERVVNKAKERSGRTFGWNASRVIKMKGATRGFGDKPVEFVRLFLEDGG